MTCPCLTGTHLKTCSAPPDEHRPGGFQFEQYCTTSWHTVCPLLRLPRPWDGWRMERPVRLRRSRAGFNPSL